MPTLIMTVPGSNGGKAIDWDYVLSENVYRDCIDSAETIAMLKSYIANRKEGNKLGVISLLNKVEDYDPGEDLSQPKSFFGNLIVSVYYDTVTYKPREFVFYNDSFEKIYSGDTWKK